MSRIKRIIKADKELDMMSSEATFLVAVATEYFIKHFMEEGYTKARLEKRRIVNYKDMANVVSRSEEFEFLRGKCAYPLLKPPHPIPSPGKDVNKCIRIAQMGFARRRLNFLPEPQHLLFPLLW